MEAVPVIWGVGFNVNSKATEPTGMYIYIIIVVVFDLLCVVCLFFFLSPRTSSRHLVVVRIRPATQVEPSFLFVVRENTRPVLDSVD